MGPAAGVSKTHCSTTLRPDVDWVGVTADPGRSAGVEEEVLTCSRAPLTLNLPLMSDGGGRINVSEGCFPGLVSFPAGHITLPLE